jgi:N-acetylglutamate synthase-like GNAT family acetyltransferase
MADNFMFLHTGKSSKEFRLVKNVPAEHIADIIPPEETKVVRAADVTEEYRLSVATPDDAEDIAKLIYRTYGYTYAKDDIYFPKKNELALASGEKFAVMVRTSSGDAAGHFAAIRSPDSNIGEVGEVVVATAHRRRGLMTRMLNALIGLAQKNKLAALYGEAVAVHPISQIVNHKLGFHSSAVLLANMPLTKYRDLVESYPQDVPVVIDFLLLDEIKAREVCLPRKYRRILTKIYGRQGIQLKELHPLDEPLPQKTVFDLSIRYDNQTATVVIEDYGGDLAETVGELSVSLREEGLNTIFFDLPLDNPGTAAAVKTFQNHRYLFSGLMFLFHKERDYLRMQHTTSDLDMDLVHVYSDMAHEIKSMIDKERQWTTKSSNAGSASG